MVLMVRNDDNIWGATDNNKRLPKVCSKYFVLNKLFENFCHVYFSLKNDNLVILKSLKERHTVYYRNLYYLIQTFSTLPDVAVVTTNVASSIVVTDSDLVHAVVTVVACGAGQGLVMPLVAVPWPANVIHLLILSRNAKSDNVPVKKE